MTGDVVFEVLRLLLATVFAVAGVAKLMDLSGASTATQGFGAPKWLARPLAVFLSCLEIAIAAGLLFTASSRVAGAVGVALLIVFAAAVAVARLRGQAPDCHCFGRIHSAPAGWGVVARNVALAALAVVVVSYAATPIRLPAVLFSLLIAQTALVAVLIRRYGRALRRIEELETREPQSALEVGQHAPEFSLTAADGGLVTLDDLLSPGRPVLLVFADPTCGPCQALLPRVADWQRSLADELILAVVSGGTREENLALSRRFGLDRVLVQHDREVSEAFGVRATPSALLIGADGRIQHTPVGGADAIEQLVDPPTRVEQPSWRQPTRAPRELVAATAGAGALALAAASAHGSTGTQEQQSPNPELQAIDAALKAAGPRIAAASRRSLKTDRALATLMGGRALRAKRTAARKALAAERRTVLVLRGAVAKLPGTSREASNVKVLIDNSLSLHAQSLAKRRQAIGAAPKIARRLLAESRELFLMSVWAGSAARELLGPGG